MRPIWFWRLGVLLMLLGWFGLVGGLSPLDRWGFDTFLRLKSSYSPEVSNRIAHLDITQKQLDSWSGVREEYDGIAELINQLRLQGAQVIALDLMLIRGKPADFARFWEEVAGQDDVVLGRTLEESSRLPEGSNTAAGLLYVEADSDGNLRRYRWHRNKLPSLALAAFLNFREQEWTPKIVENHAFRITDYDSHGKSVERRLPEVVLLDERAGWQTATPRNFVHVSPEQLAQWNQEGGNPHLEGRIVFVGYVAPGSGDLGTTPLNARVPKVQVHALALNALLQDSWFQPTSFPMNAMLSLLTLLMAGLMQRRRPLVWLLGTLILLTAAMAVPLHTHWFLPWVTLLLAWSVCCFGEYWLAARLRHDRLLQMQQMADSDDPLILKVIGTHQVVRKVGTGGFATVYQAIPTDTLDINRSIAVKIVHPASAENDEFRRRFLREIRISSQLRHPHIVEVYPAAKDAKLLYLTMEFLQGRPLRDYLVPDQPLAEAQVVSVLRPMLEALEYAHGLSVVHRDLKPENVMVRSRSLTPPWEFYDLKLVDFGLAFDSQASQLTRSGEVFGTLDYLAPERIQGSNDDVRSDLYAVGVMAYEMLHGSNPFKGSSPAEAILFRLTQDPVHLSEVQPHLTPGLVQLVTELIARDPEQRPRSAREVLDRL